MNKNIKYVILATIIIVVAAIMFILFYNSEPRKVAEPKPYFSVDMIKCELDQRGDGVWSFFFDVNITGNKTRLPAQIFFKINRIYNLEKYEITREYKLEKIYNTNETIENVFFVINRIYRDYMYLPSQNFDFQLWYCEFTDQQKNYIENNNTSIFDALDDYCLLMYDYERANKRYIHVVGQNPGEQCEVIQRFKP